MNGDRGNAGEIRERASALGERKEGFTLQKKNKNKNDTI